MSPAIDPLLKGSGRPAGEPGSQAPSPPAGTAQRRAEKKYALFLESVAGQKPTGELLREWGFSSAELSRIRAAVRRGALVELSRSRGRPRKDNRIKVVANEVGRLSRELNEMVIQVDLLRAKQECGIVGAVQAANVDSLSRARLVEAVDAACAAGMPVLRACEILQLSRQRYYGWRKEFSSGT